MAKSERLATESAVDVAPWHAFLKDPVQTVGLGSRGSRRGLEGSVKFDWRSIPASIAEFILFEGGEGELRTCSTAAERERDKLLEDGKMEEAAAYSIAENAVRFMSARVEAWQRGEIGRTRGTTDPVEQRAQQIASARFIAMVAAGKLKGVPANAKLSTEQKARGRDLLLERQGEELRTIARNQLAEEARKAKEAAQIGAGDEIDLGSF